MKCGFRSELCRVQEYLDPEQCRLVITAKLHLSPELWNTMHLAVEWRAMKQNPKSNRNYKTAEKIQVPKEA